MRLEGGPWLTVASLRLGGREVLVAPGELPEGYRVHATRAGITLLHPWANRLASAQGVPPGAPRDPGGLPIHGLPARGEGWVVDGRTATLRDARWPAPHDVRVTFELEDDALRVVTELQADDAPLPVAFGWHPYLRPSGPREGWRLALPARRALAVDDRGLPTGDTASLPAEDGPLGERTFDDAFDEVAPGSVWRAGELEVVLDEGYRCAQVFAPADAEVVSLEPMVAPVDPFREGAAPVDRAWRAVFTLRLAA